jgi:hypothetical protein
MKKVLSLLLVFVFMTGVSFQSAASAATKGYATVTHDVNVREKSSTSSKKVGVLKKGTKITASAKQVSYKMDKTKIYTYKDNYGETITYTFGGTKNGWNQWNVSGGSTVLEKEDSKGLYSKVPEITNATSTDLQYPIKVGAKWVSLGMDGHKANAQVIGVNKTIKVKAGTFKNVVVLEVDDTEVKEIDYYAPSVGVIKGTITMQDDKNHPLMMELVKLKKK